MAKKSDTASNGGLGLCSVVGVVFVILKLIHVIDWSWVWVLSPFWIGIALILLLYLIAFIIALTTHRNRRIK